MIRLRQQLLITAFIIIQHFVAIPAIGQEHTNTPESKPLVKSLANDSIYQADAMYFDALKARIKGDDNEEEKLLRKVVEFKPTASGAYYDLSRISFKQNRSDKAREYIQKAIALDDNNLWYKRQYAEILSLGNKFDEAADQFMKVAQKEKYNEGDILKAAKLYQHVGKYKEALAALDVLLARDAANEEALEQKKSLYLKTNDVDGAAGIIQIQINQNPTEGTYYAELAQLYDNNKLPEKAKELYSKIEKDFGDEAVVQYHLAGYYKKNNDIKKYEQYVKKLALNKTINTEMRIEVLRAYIIEAGNDTAKRKVGIDLTENIVSQYPEDAKMHSFYGDVLLLNQQDALAVEQYKRVISIDPSSYYDWEKVLQGYTGRNDADSLLKYSEKALRLFPNQAMVHYLNGIGYLNKQNYNNCIKAVNRAIDMQPEDKPEPLAQMYTTLGDAYYFIKQYNLSDSSFERALKLQPGNLYVLNNYSYYLSVRGTRLDDAERMSKKTIELSKDEPSFLDTYGWILYKQAKYDKALEYIQKAIDVSGESADGTLWEHLGDVNYKLGNIDKAVLCWMKAKEKGTENIDIDKKIKDRKLYES